jgi:hypothetical protein
MATPDPSATDAPHRPEPTKSPKTTPPSPQSQGLYSDGEVPPGSDSTQIPLEDPPHWIPCVDNTFSKDPDFIKAGFHIGRFITAAVNTEEERVVTEALKGT